MDKYKISLNDGREVEPSEYQNNIFEFVEKGVGNLVINASAGSAKTTTIVNCLKLIGDKKCLFIAFNKAIVDDITNKIGKRDNIKIATFHSLGYSILRENGYSKGDKEQIDEFKYKNYIKNNIKDLSPSFVALNKKDQRTYVENIIKIVDYFRYFDSVKGKKAKNILKDYAIVPISNEMEIAQNVLSWGKEHTETIDYTDMVWLPNALNLNPHHKYDFVFIDEGQDTSVMEKNLVERVYKRGCRYIVVGDEDQQINVWCGANKLAFHDFKKGDNTREMELPISYRCPKVVVEEASRFSKRIQSAPDAIEGTIRYKVSKNAPVSGDMVLCRTTAPLVELQLKYFDLNKKSYIKGSEQIKEEYLEYIKGTGAEYVDLEMKTKDGLISKLYLMLFNEKENIKKTFHVDDEDAMSHEKFLKMYDAIESIKVLAKGMNTVTELKDKINVILGGKDEEAIILSTVHKAKGLEADNVYILYRSLMPSPTAKLDWEVQSENNLIYVAYTRAKKSLNFMEESGRWNIKFGYLNVHSMIMELKDIAKKIGYEFNVNLNLSGNTEENNNEKKENEEEKDENEAIPIINKSKKFNIRNLL